MAGRQADPRVAVALRAAGHPLRLDILQSLAADGPTSPSRFARAHGAATLRESAYHFRALRDGDLIKLDEVRLGSGAIEHRYDLTPLGIALTQILPRLSRAA
jgi:DNA-binding transcriptional ArsR family regulator